jgi:hypothetical protein
VERRVGDGFLQVRASSTSSPPASS